MSLQCPIAGLHYEPIVWDLNLTEPCHFQKPFQLSVGLRCSQFCNFLLPVRPKTPAVLERQQSLDTCSLHTWAFFWEALYPQLAKYFRVLMVFCTHLSLVGLPMSNLYTYWNKSPSSNLKFLKSLASISPNKLGEFLNP